MFTFDIYHHDIKAALVALAESPAIDAELTWDGAENYRVQPSKSGYDEGHRRILTQDDLSNYCDGDLSPGTVIVAARWVTENQAVWFNGAE